MSPISEIDATGVEVTPKVARLEDSRSSAGGEGRALRYLQPEELPLWDALVDASPQGSPFTRSWWLKAVGGTVRILGYFKREKLLAGIPLYAEKRWGMTLLTMPKLTQTLGPVLAAPPTRAVTATSEEMDILAAFAKEISRYSIFFQAFHPSLQNWSPFHWNGFKQTCRATQIVNVRDPGKIWDGMAKWARHNVRKAEHSGLSIKVCSPEILWQAEAKTFARQHMKVPHSVEHLRQLYAAAKSHQSGECFAVVDSAQNVHAAVLLIWDKSRVIAVASGNDPTLRSSGAMSMLMWHSIQFAAERSPIFDFGGSMLQPVENFQRSFGTTQVPYMWVMKFPLWLRMYLTARGKV